MRSNPKPPRARDLAMIHMGAAQLGLDRETYEAMLWTVARVRSAADLDLAGRARVLQHLKSRGADIGGRPAQAAPAKKIRALWAALAEAGKLHGQGGEPALLAFVRRMARVERLEWLTPPQSTRIIEALKAMLARPPSPSPLAGEGRGEGDPTP